MPLTNRKTHSTSPCNGAPPIFQQTSTPSQSLPATCISLPYLTPHPPTKTMSSMVLLNLILSPSRVLVASSIASVGLGPQGKEAVGHGFEMPCSGSSWRKSLGPFQSEIGRDGPPHVVVAKPHADQVSTLGRCLSVDKSLSPVQNCQIVDEVHITSLSGDFELRCPRNAFDGVQGFRLAAVELGKPLGAGITGAPQQRRSAKVGDQPPLVVEDDWAALEPGPGKNGASAACTKSLPPLRFISAGR